MFKQYYTYFHTLFHLYVFSKNTNSVTRNLLINGPLFITFTWPLFLSHIRDKNKFKNRDSLFPLIQCFKTTFCYILVNISKLLFVSFGYILVNISKLLFVSFGSMFQDFSSLLHTQNSLHFHSPFSLLLLYIYMPTTLNVISSQIHSNKK